MEYLREVSKWVIACCVKFSTNSYSIFLSTSFLTARIASSIYLNCFTNSDYTKLNFTSVLSLIWVSSDDISVFVFLAPLYIFCSSYFTSVNSRASVIFVCRSLEWMSICFVVVSLNWSRSAVTLAMISYTLQNRSRPSHIDSHERLIWEEKEVGISLFRFICSKTKLSLCS